MSTIKAKQKSKIASRLADQPLHPQVFIFYAGVLLYSAFISSPFDPSGSFMEFISIF
jgi:hypothetical protein